MQIKKVARKLAAVGVGAVMLGATLGGALAQTYNLADYPSPYVTNGALDNTVIVVGKVAQTSDVLGAVDIAVGLQAEAVSKEAIDIGGSLPPTVSDGVKLEKSGDKFNYNDTIYKIMPEPLDSVDLPEMLADGTFDDRKGDNRGSEDYDQDLQFEVNVGRVLFTQPKDMDAGNYLAIDKNDRVYNYTLEFRSSVDFDSSAVGNDMVGNTIEIQGRVYTITEARASSGIMSRLKFVGGDSVIWLVQDQPYTIGDHTVTVVDVDQGETKCGINVDGVTKWVDDGTTAQFGDLSVGVLDVVAVYTKDYDADTCELSLGSNELILEDGKTVKVNDAELEGSQVTFLNTGAGYWDGFTVRFQAGREDAGVNQDNIFLEMGDSWTDPVFGNFKILFEGITADYEEMELEVGGEDALFTFVNNDGKPVEVPFFYVDSVSRIIPGYDDDEPLLQAGQATGAGYIPAVTDVEGVHLWYVTPGGEAHVLEISDLTCGSSLNKTTIKDITYGTTVASDKELVNDCKGGAETISLGSLGSIVLNLTSSSVYYDSTYGGATAKTGYDNLVSFTNDTITLVENAGDEMPATTVTMRMEWDGSSEINLVAPSGSPSLFGSVDNSEDDDDTKWYYSYKGTMFKFDAEDKLSLEIMAPEEDAIANVFVAPHSASVIAGGSGELTNDKVNPFSVGLAVLDEDAETMSKNMIVVGGPCANTIAAGLMGNPDSCTEGFEPGKAMIKYFARNGRAALLVAGYEAQDTLGASYVLADHADYTLSGDEVEVVVASLSDITVRTV